MWKKISMAAIVATFIAVLLRSGMPRAPAAEPVADPREPVGLRLAVA
jgi:hypothetical protein